MMQSHFYSLSNYISTKLDPGEFHLSYLDGEESDFCRLNHCKIRQAGSVFQYFLNLSLIKNRKIASHTFMITGDKTIDRGRAASVLNQLRNRLEMLSEDPYLLYAQKVNSSEQVGDNHLPDSQDTMDEIRELGLSTDLVGIYASGKIVRGFANAMGQKNWFEKHTFNFDWSLYHKDDKAVKLGYAGFEWDRNIFKSKMDSGRHALEMLSRAPITIDPGKYRVFLAPSALTEFIDLLNWGGFGIKSQKTKNSPLIKMIEEGQKLNCNVSMSENTQDGISPNFDKFGFIKPDRVSIIRDGAFDHALVSPRSAKEFNIQTNGATPHETAESFDMRPGTIDGGDILNTLDTGIYMNNSWYLNYSDRNNCRITGMTRFASFWVENGEIRAPVNVMRFDDSLLRMLGENLVGLTNEREFILSADTYHCRTTTSTRLPGAIIEDMTFTL